MNRIILIIISLALMTGCQTTKPIDMSVIQQSNYIIDESILSKNKDVIITDSLENNFYYAGYDFNSFLLGNSYYHIMFTYHPGNDYITATFRTMQQNWISADSLSLYIGKEKVINKLGENRRNNTSVVDGGSLGNTVYTHELFVIRLPLDLATKIANSQIDKVTIRFQTKQGYVDEKIHPQASMSELKSVVDLAKATNSRL